MFKKYTEESSHSEKAKKKSSQNVILKEKLRKMILLQ